MAQPKLIDGKMFAVTTKTDIKHLEAASGVLQCLAVMNVRGAEEIRGKLHSLIVGAKSGPLAIGTTQEVYSMTTSVAGNVVESGKKEA